MDLLLYFVACIILAFPIYVFYCIKYPNIKILSIDGNIGSGKSTFLKKLRDKYDDEFEFVDEPVELWRTFKDSSDKNILENFYSDKRRWSYTFQNMAFITRTIYLRNSVNLFKQKIMLSSPTKLLLGKLLLRKTFVIISERSIFTDKNIFLKMLYDDGLVDASELAIYDYWFEYLKDNVILNGILYIRCTPEISKQRITKRERSEEQSIGMDYLQRLHDYHEKWLMDGNNRKPLLVIDGNVEFENDENQLDNMFDKLKKLINEI